LFDMPAKESDSRLPRQHFSPETAQSSQYTAPPRIRDCERFRWKHGYDIGGRVGQTCGGLAGIPCDGTLWCDPDPGQCGGHDIAGKCVEIKTAGCTFEFAPVCGCNNETYGNDCGRLKAKEPKKSQGECKKEDK
jgi:hypothetical protein